MHHINNAAKPKEKIAMLLDILMPSLKTEKNSHARAITNAVNTPPHT
jgi:hypothetical protein